MAKFKWLGLLRGRPWYQEEDVQPQLRPHGQRDGRQLQVRRPGARATQVSIGILFIVYCILELTMLSLSNLYEDIIQLTIQLHSVHVLVSKSLSVGISRIGRDKHILPHRF